jgi:hypothetical protein
VFWWSGRSARWLIAPFWRRSPRANITEISRDNGRILRALPVPSASEPASRLCLTRQKIAAPGSHYRPLPATAPRTCVSHASSAASAISQVFRKSAVPQTVCRSSSNMGIPNELDPVLGVHRGGDLRLRFLWYPRRDGLFTRILRECHSNAAERLTTGRQRLPGGEPRRASQRNSRRAGPVAARLIPTWRVGDAVRWQGRAAVFRRDIGDGQHAEVQIGERIYRVRLIELS